MYNNYDFVRVLAVNGTQVSYRTFKISFIHLGNVTNLNCKCQVGKHYSCRKISLKLIKIVFRLTLFTGMNHYTKIRYTTRTISQ